MDVGAGLKQLWSPPVDRKALYLNRRESSPDIFQEANNSRITLAKAFDHLSTYAGREAIDWVYDCSTLIAETIAGADFHFEKQRGKKMKLNAPKGDKEFESAPSDLTRLFTKPNPYCNWQDFFMLGIIDWLLIGNSFWLRHKTNSAGKPAALYRLMPQYVQIIPGKTRLVDAYEYHVPHREKVVFRAQDVIHFRRPNPHSEYIGAGIVKGGARVFDMELALTRSQESFFAQGTKLSGVLESDRNVPDSIWKKIKAQFTGMYSGPNNAYKVAMLTHGMKFRPIQATAAEADYRTLGPASRDRIFAMFRVSPALVGYTGGLDRQAVKEAQRIFDNKTLKRGYIPPLEDAITQAITEAWGLSFKIDHEYEMPIEDQIDLAADFATLPGVRVREVRRMAKLDPLGDENDEIVLNLPGENDNESEVKDRPLGGEPGRPPNPENTRAFPKSAAVRQPATGGTVTPRRAIRQTKALEEQLDRIEAKLHGS
jgi:HK97 family phage portal protein